MPGFQREPRGVDASQDRTLGEAMAPSEAAAKLPAASLEVSFGLCYSSVPQQVAMLKALRALEDSLCSPMGSVWCIFAQDCFISSTDT